MSFVYYFEVVNVKSILIAVLGTSLFLAACSNPFRGPTQVDFNLHVRGWSDNNLSSSESQMCMSAYQEESFITVGKTHYDEKAKFRVNGLDFPYDGDNSCYYDLQFTVGDTIDISVVTSKSFDSRYLYARLPLPDPRLVDIPSIANRGDTIVISFGMIDLRYGNNLTVYAHEQGTERTVINEYFAMSQDTSYSIVVPEDADSLVISNYQSWRPDLGYTWNRVSVGAVWTKNILVVDTP
jgi:hypothetical protein